LQATIGGQVNVNDAPGLYVTVKLLKADKHGKFETLRQKEALQQGGRYSFHIWAKNVNVDYCVIANFNGVEEKSPVFRAQAGRAVEVPVISIKATLVTQATR
jgi:hypothetical protein